jgi:2-hydroxychromene-2-carboxylate isomerase
MGTLVAVATSFLDVAHYSDPACPWAWSASPALAVLQWRYGEQLRWRHVMIGLAESGAEYEQRGFGPERMALGYRSFRDRGMPFSTEPRERVHGTWPMCRVVVAARLTAPEREWAVFRALQFAQFTTTLPLDDPAAIAEALARVPGIDPHALVTTAGSPAVDAAFRADMDEARSAAGGATEFQDRAATAADGRVRFTAPSVVFSGPSRSLEVGGFQPLEAYDVAIANLDRSLARRPPADDALAVLAAFPDGLTTAEVAAVMTADKMVPDRDAAEDALIALAAAGDARRQAHGNDALWLPAAAVVGDWPRRFTPERSEIRAR